MQNYDWLHLHHEDFTGQYGKFYRSHRNAQWYKNQKKQFELVASTLGYKSVHEQKKQQQKKLKIMLEMVVSYSQCVPQQIPMILHWQ